MLTLSTSLSTDTSALHSLCSRFLSVTIKKQELVPWFLLQFENAVKICFCEHIILAALECHFLFLFLFQGVRQICIKVALSVLVYDS